MAPIAVPRKWRPPLALIVVAVLLSVVALPTAIVIVFRTLANTGSGMGSVELGALAVSLLLTLVIGYVFSRTITGPIESLVRRTHEIAQGGRASLRPLEHYGTSEIALLSQSFIDLAGRLVDRSEAVQSFAAHVGHELKSPLTAIKAAAELLRDADEAGENLPPGQRERFLDGIIADADRLARLLDRLRELARAEHGTLSGSSSASEAIDALRARFGALEITATGALTRPIRLANETFAIVLSHLFDNAVQHGARHVVVDAAVTGERLRLTVTDDGAGISPSNRPMVFEPFFTTRRESGGTGMGLRIVRTMLEAHGGSIALEESETGATFALSVPLA